MDKRHGSWGSAEGAVVVGGPSYTARGVDDRGATRPQEELGFPQEVLEKAGFRTPKGRSV